MTPPLVPSRNECSVLRMGSSAAPEAEAGPQTCTAVELGPDCTWLVMNLAFFSDWRRDGS